ncbi:helix-turn-helix domain-containing protein [Catenulispora sp. NF23]|uniref:Helix-turn-helix domain-containing protein n=1 Tax=Catenulispora pinistramenti TaxID=2705254 RepID=A0ABS5L5K3_9ACTN|nr:helix-turn-helix domain-containing protein [Catenulispora pinistramenti]MBS2553517.1 helix-turn-helix domain-containing protein [Catenulispora pinistramenti]
MLADVAKTHTRPCTAGNPTIPRILLGAELRRLRTAAGITRDAAGYAIRGSGSKISRMELGRIGFKPRDVADLLTLYGVHDAADRDPLLALTAQANAQSWWRAFADVVPAWFESYLGMEDSASIIRCYQTRLVPGLLQTEDYARSVIRLGNPLAEPAEIERRVALRMNRTGLLHRPHPPKLWAVVDEAVLRHPPGGHDATMHAQIQHLLKLSRLPHITIQVVPTGRSPRYADAGASPFSILRFPEAALPDIVYLEQLTSATYLDKTEDLDVYTTVMDQLCLDAVPAADSVRFLVR